MPARIVFLGVILLACPAFAKSMPKEINACDYAEFATPPFQTATLTGEKAEQIWVQGGGYTMQSDDWRASAPKSIGQCPNLSHPNVCSPKGYVSPGDKVLVTRTMKNFTCITDEHNKTVLSGWVPTRNVAAADAPSDWSGNWTISLLHNATPTLKLTRDGNLLQADAQIIWYKNHNAHLQQTALLFGKGELDDAHAALTFSAPAAFGELPEQSQACKANVWLAGDYLVVQGDGACFDGRISLSGVYRRGDHV